jgi:hypothetical protein
MFFNNFKLSVDILYNSPNLVMTATAVGFEPTAGISLLIIFYFWQYTY